MRSTAILGSRLRPSTTCEPMTIVYKVTVTGDCGKTHASFDEWQQCQVCETIIKSRVSTGRTFARLPTREPGAMHILGRREWAAAAVQDCGAACGEIANAMRLPEDARNAELARFKNALGLVNRAKEWLERSVAELETK